MNARVGQLTVVTVLFVSLAGCEKGPAANAPAGPTGKVVTDGDQSQDGQATAEDMTIPDQPVAGTLAGKEFQLDRAEFSGQLELIQGEDFFPDLAVTLYLWLDDEPLPGKEWKITGETSGTKPHIHLKYKEDADSFPQTEIVTDNYSLQLKFGEMDDQGQVRGEIFLQTDEKPGVNIAGTFSVEAPADRKLPPPTWHQPWVIAKVDLQDEEEHDLVAGYIGVTESGEQESNLAGTTLAKGDAMHVSSTTFHPRDSFFGWNEAFGLHGRHIHVTPGKYIFYITEADTFVAWQVVDIQADTGLELEFEFDTSQAGSLMVQVPDAETGEPVRLVPLNEDGTPPLELDGQFGHFAFSGMIEPADVENGMAFFTMLTPGKYRAYFGDETRDVDVPANTKTSVSFDN